jgi:hypothetical protein
LCNNKAFLIHPTSLSLSVGLTGRALIGADLSENLWIRAFTETEEAYYLLFVHHEHTSRLLMLSESLAS